MTDSELGVTKIDGRTKEARDARKAAAAARSEELTRQPARSGTEVRGRNGEILSRSLTNVIDEFEIPENLKDKDWDMQWCVVSVHGDTDIALNLLQDFEANGWRAVPACRFPGRYMKAGTAPDAAIIRKGQMLMERPMVLSLQAREEDERKARRQMSDRDQSLMGRKANLRNSMPEGFEMGGKYRGTGGDLRMSIDKGLDIPKPSYPVAGSGE